MQLEGARDDYVSLSVRTTSPPDCHSSNETVSKPPGMPGDWEFLFGLTWQVDIKKIDYPMLAKDKRILSIRRIDK